MRSDETSSKKSKDKKRKKMFFVDTCCTSRWLSNSFFSNSGWRFGYLIKRNARLQHRRESLQAPPSAFSVKPSDSGLGRLVSVSSDWSSCSLCCPWRCAILMDHLPNFHLPLRHATDQRWSGLCCQHSSHLLLAQAHSPRASPPTEVCRWGRGTQIPVHSAPFLKVYLKSI